MPKEKKDPSLSTNKSRSCPYRCSTSHSTTPLNKNPLQAQQDLKEYEDARCPVCMERPHNAILLLCSSHHNNCRPYMCDTSYRHSNCFDQFRKSFSEPQPPEAVAIQQPPATTLPTIIPESTVNITGNEEKEKSNLVCPLCRGTVNGWVVVDAARVFMNAKSRSCACESCDFSGTYSDLRKHARLVHPLVRPSEADPDRQRDWRRMERQRDLGDLLSTLQSSIGEERIDEGSSALSFDEGGWLTVFFLIRVFRPGNSSRSSSWSGTARARAQVTVRRRVGSRLWGESYDGETRDDDDDDNESWDGGSGSGSHNLFRLSRRRLTPEDEES